MNNVEVLISKALIDSVISHDESFLINNVLKDYDKMEKEVKNLRLNPSFGLSYAKVKIEDFTLFMKQSFINLVNHKVLVEKIQKVKIQKLQGQKAEEYCFYQNVR